MIAACPKCRTRYRVDAARLGAEGLRLRCTSCQTVFRARAPVRPAPGSEAPRPAPEQPAPRDRRRLVLVGDPDAAGAKATCELLEAAGLETVSAHDGVEALLTLQRTLPRAVVLDAGLPRMLGSEICELVKRNESLRSTWVVLVGANDPQPHRRPPGSPYGADAHVERPELPQALLPVLSGFGLPVQPPGPGTEPTLAAPPAEQSVTPAPQPAPRPEPPRQAAPASTPTAPVTSVGAPPVPSADEGEELDELRAKAERLARIIVSDIVLYNEQKFAAAVAGGDVLRSMAAELDEGRALLAGRIDEGVRGTRDFVADELLRVARSRGAS